VFGPSESKKHLLESEVGGHGRQEVIVNADAVEFIQTQDTYKSQQIWKPLSNSKRVLQISTDL
jgi:hypothetical protein